MQRLFLGLAVLRNAPAGIALIMAAVLAAVALTFVAANMTTAGPTPTYPVVVDPGDETGAIDLATLTYDEAKTLLLPILDGTEIKLLFPAEPGLGQVEMSGTTISFDDTDGVITFNGSSTLLALVLATKFKTSFTATWGTDPTPELVLDSVAKSDISTSDLLTLLPIAVPSGLPELTLSNASLSVVTSPVPAISVFADATFLSVSTSVLYSTADRDNDSGTASEFLFGINASSFALSAFGVTLPFSSPDLPVSMTLANAEQTLSSSELTAPELTFFTIFYGSEPFDVGVDTGLNFATRLPFSALPNPIIKELGLTPADTVLLEGSVEVNTSFELVALSLKASMPSEVSLPGVPGWISLTGDGLSLELGYDSSEGASEISLAVAGDFEADLNGDVLGFHLGLQLKSGDALSVEVTGNTTTPWVHPFGIPWLTLEEISLTLTAEGSELGALLDSTFTIGSEPEAKSFQIVLEVTGDPGSLAATVTATSLDPLTSNDILDLLGDIVGVEPPAGLPELALNNLTISIETGEATALSISADITFLGVAGSVLFSVIWNSALP